ncbi:inactive atromentin synthetase invA3-like [Jatropha curcas]|uniref:inactive atromentin synthetase invA3-like n=1 Tax=Jatropha curcas TaxID=180498 RepID=UPI00189413A0|nr:inactive atromentin synthetase invA3-like [Jatropha curcas]
MDLDKLERELFSKVQTIDYYTTVLKIKGLEDMPTGFYYFGEYMDDPTTIGHPVAVQKFYADTDIFLFWSYGNSVDIKGPTVTDLATKVVKNMGAEVEKVVLQRRFQYFPHVSSEDMKDGFYQKLEAELQGLHNTYYVGGLMAFELTERNSSYAMALICKHFANNDPLPVFPYVKSLFPLQSDRWDRKPQELGEYPGVEFPDLSTLTGYLKHWGTHKLTQNTTLYTWINEEGAVVCQRTYAELLVNASCIAHKLLTSQKPVIKPGDRVLLVHVPGLEFVDAFFGCLIAKVLPVPVLPPDPLQRGGQALLKIENIAKSCNAVAILSTRLYHTAVRAGSVKSLISLTVKKGKSSARWPNLLWLYTDSWTKNSKDSLPENMSYQSDSHPDDLCFLQFTSGSTGDAKGVMITHGGLIHNVKLMRRRYKSTSKTVLVSWLPQYHDMGLIGGLFTALVSGGSAILFSPMTFIKKPLLWLHIMSKYKATHSAGPNFAFELVVRRLETEKEKLHNYELSSMIFLMVAAEPVRQKTLKRFVELTRPFGLSQEVMAPGYGLAENCVFVSCAYGESKPILIDWQGRVCCGYAYSDDADVDIRIVDPETGEELQEVGKEGEIWISSPSAGVGYWGREEHSQRTFRNVLKNHPGRIYTSTGDLGRIIDGKLFITGRIKDLIIVAGRNIYSADVEKTVESASELLRPGCCAVVGVPEEVLSAKGISVPDGSDQVGLVVIAEVRDGKPVDKDVVEDIKTRVTEEHGVSVACVKLIKPRTISKTTSGKIKRFECLKNFTDGTLNVVPDPILSKRALVRSFTTGTCKEGRTPRQQLLSSPILTPKLGNKEIVEFLKVLISEQTGIPVKNISTTENLVAYGIDSIGVVRAAQKLSDFLGVPVGAVDIFTATCIAELASFSENLVMKSEPHLMNSSSHLPEPDIDSIDLVTEISKTHQIFIWILQFLALIYVSIMLSFPAYLSISGFTTLTSTDHASIDKIHWSSYLIPLASAPLAWIFCMVSTCAPLAWIFCMVSTCICIAFLGNSFLRPNYALNPDISIWSVDFVKWWALYKVQEISSKVFAEHLRGTPFLNYWFEMLGAKIGSSVVLDTTAITDPSLVSIGDGAVIAEGALIQAHEVKNGILSFLPIRIGRNSSVGPYAVIQKGNVLGEDAHVPPLQKCEGGKVAFNSSKVRNIQKVNSFRLLILYNHP